MPSRTVIVLLVVGAAFRAQAQSLHVAGTAGYLSEWELDGEVSTLASGDVQLSGPLHMKHVGLCTVNGPVEKSATISVEVRKSRSAASSPLHATFTFDDGERCSYTGQWPGKSTGTMDCATAKGVPLTLSIE